MRTWTFMASSFWVGLACGDDDSGSTGETSSLDCGFFSSESSCIWSVHRRVIQDCALPTDEQGVLSADRSLCTYADGAEVDFDGPLDLGDFGFTSIRFTIRRGGADCVSWNEDLEGPEQSQVIVVAGETFRQSVDATGRIEIQCPGGDRFVGSSTELAGCLDDGPGTTNIGSSAGLGFEIAFPGEAPVSVFQCALP
ncbi:MAG: hypothetical protein ACFB9M_12315 [Myxococcota bacterium]